MKVKYYVDERGSYSWGNTLRRNLTKNDDYQDQLSETAQSLFDIMSKTATQPMLSRLSCKKIYS